MINFFVYRASGSVISWTFLTSEDGYGGRAGGRDREDRGGNGGGCGGGWLLSEDADWLLDRLGSGSGAAAAAAPARREEAEAA